MFGFACNENKRIDAFADSMAHQLTKRLSEARRSANWITFVPTENLR
jgi:S-adenosylmethionine synthetase